MIQYSLFRLRLRFPYDYHICQFHFRLGLLGADSRITGEIGKPLARNAGWSTCSEKVTSFPLMGIHRLSR